MVVEDWPSFATRGVMLDVSRDRVPTMQSLRALMGPLAALKINHLQLYTEHTFAYTGHETAWRGWSPLTPDEVRELDECCRAYGIELSANQNCFGHLAKWLNHPKYQHLAETTDDWVFQNETEAFPRSGPFSLCPTDPRSIEFIKDLLRQLLPCFNSPLVNIGCDETFDVGWGRSKQAVAERGRAAVYFDFVRKIAEVVNSHGKRPMFWADIALTHPESIPLIPKDMIGLAWGYEPDAKFGEWCSRLRAAGREAWVCPGTSSWRSITGRTAERRANIRRAAREGAANGATGFLITDWGDSGHHQQWPIALHAIAEAADAAWNADNLDNYDPRAASRHVMGDPSQKLGPWLDALGDADSAMRRIGGRMSPGQPPTHLRNSSVLFCDMHMPDRSAKDDDEKLRRGLASLPVDLWDHAAARVHELAAIRPPVAHDLTSAELSHTLDVASFAAVRGLWRRTGKYSAKDRKELASWLRTILAKHRELWLATSREGGLEDSCGFYQRIIDDMERDAT
jgi:hexosaminidase